MDHASVVRDEFVALVGTAACDAAGSLLGVEQEFTVRTHAGWPVDFGDLLPDLVGWGADALDPSLPGARRCRSGAVLSADGREAEVAIPPVPVRPRFADDTAAWGRAARRELTELLPESFSLSGYSTHLSVSVDDTRSPAVAGLYTRTFALGLMLLVDRATSPGLIVRPRPGREASWPVTVQSRVGARSLPCRRNCNYELVRPSRARDGSSTAPRSAPT